MCVFGLAANVNPFYYNKKTLLKKARSRVTIKETLLTLLTVFLSCQILNIYSIILI